VEQVIRARNYGGADSGAADQWLIEMTMESSDFSTREISLSEFAIPDGYVVGAAPLINLSLLSARRMSNSTGAGQAPAANSAVVPALSLTKRVDAEYSREAREAGLQGTVMLLLEVTPEGTVRDVRVRRTLGLGLDERAVAAAKQWQYKPFNANGRSVMEVVEVPFQVEPRGPWRIVGSKFPFPPMQGLQVKPVLSGYVSPAAAACAKDLVYVPVDLTVGRDGKPNDVRVGATIDDSIGNAALDAVRSWSFSPGTVAGQAEAIPGTILLECRAPATSVSADTGVSLVGGGVSQPAVIFKVDPEYSEEARRAKYSGTVVFSLIVDTEGRAHIIGVVKTLGMGLDQEAVIAVNQWRWKPGMKGGQPVNVRATIEVNFRLL
jgi:TonB family protein